ncbi:spore coat polysaccharide biosynthesis protein F [Nitritalea halalkaliphila LW7]|uniref:Spore coat polysaccharide biosynthesis protein F n=2 Tax=Nitritalea TaxID=1187887 RepID=I5C616_9BACT|nr:spore coat polysaccharide biosynthesis protein F [Nitritalea halalkaliphila LW7]
MLPVLGDTLVARVVRRAQLTGYEVIVATSTNQEDDILEAETKRLQVGCYRGSELDVLNRAVEAAEAFGFDAFARLCGDRPLFSVDEMRFALQEWETRAPDLITNNYLTKAIRGLTTEVIRTESLKELLKNEPTAAQREHITSGLLEHPEKYEILNLKKRYHIWNNHPGFAVDTSDDYKSIVNFIQQFPALDYELDQESHPGFTL